jgi:hypothetical protein
MAQAAQLVTVVVEAALAPVVILVVEVAVVEQ